VRYFFFYLFRHHQTKGFPSSRAWNTFYFYFFWARALTIDRVRFLCSTARNTSEYNIIILYIYIFFSSWQSWLCTVFLNIRNTTIRRILFFPKLKCIYFDVYFHRFSSSTLFIFHLKSLLFIILSIDCIYIDLTYEKYLHNMSTVPIYVTTNELAIFNNNHIDQRPCPTKIIIIFTIKSIIL